MGTSNVEGVNVQISGSVQSLVAAMNQATRVLNDSTRRMETDLSKLNQVSAAGGTTFEGMGKKIEKFSTVSVFALASLASGGKASLDGVLNSVNAVGFAFGPQAGGITLAVTSATKFVVEFFSKSREESRKTVEQFEQDVQRMVNAGESLEIRKRAAKTWFGTPDADFKDGLASLQQELVKAKAAEKAILQDGGIADHKKWKAAHEEVERLTLKVAELREEMSKLMVAATAPGLPSLPQMDPMKVQRDSVADEKEAASFAYFVAEMRRAEQLRQETEKQIKATRAYIATIKDIGPTAADMAKAISKSFDTMTADVRKNLALIRNETAKTAAAIRNEFAGEWMQLFHPLENAINQFIQQGGNLRDFWRSLWYGMVQEYSAALVHMLAKRTAFALAEKAITVRSAAASVVGFLIENAKIIAGYAARAAAATWSAIAGIPYVGPFLAPVAAAAALAGVLALAGGIGGGGGGSGSASRGAGYGAGASPSSRSAQPIHIYAMDASSFAEWATRNPSGFAAGVNGAVKNGALTSRSMGLTGV